MISFSPLSESFIQNATSELKRGSEGDFLLSYLYDLCADTDESFSVAVCLCHGTLLCRRCFDGAYEFTLPYPYRDGADTEAALCALEEYARLQEIPLVYTDLCVDDLDALCERYMHPRVHALPIEDGDTPLYLLEVLTEAMSIEHVPTLRGESVTLRAPQREDMSAYGRLCRDDSILAVWGYDFREDYPDATDEDLFTLTERDFQQGTTLPFFIYYCDRFVGEALLYAFDGRGGAECAIRILPEYRRRGIARETLSILLSYARDTLHLSYLDGACRESNEPSRALLESTMTPYTERDGILRYRTDLSSRQC